MKKLTLLAATMLGACAPTAVAPSAAIAQLGTVVENYDALDMRIEELMAANNVNGMAIAIIDRDKISHVRAHGFANVEKQVPLKTDSIMYAASITKAAFAYMVLQLVDEGKIELDRPISQYLAKPLPAYNDWSSLEGDEQWRLLTARMLLNHSSGLANLRWLEPDMDMSFHFTPGTAYAYSGEGFYLLQFVLEEGLGLDVKGGDAEPHLRPLWNAEHEHAVARGFCGPRGRWLQVRRKLRGPRPARQCQRLGIDGYDYR